MKTNFWYLFFILFFICLSCEKTNQDNEACSEPFKLKKIKRENITVEEVVYDRNCKVYEYIQEFSYKKYTYDEQNRLTKTEQAILLDPTSCFMPLPGENFKDPREAPVNFYQFFDYEDHKLTKVTKSYRVDDGYTEIFHQAFQYENDRVKEIDQFTPQDQQTEKYEYEYDDEGNVKIEKYYTFDFDEQPVLNSTTEYEYDNMNNPYRIFAPEAVPGKFTNPNNITRMKWTNIYQSGYQVTTDFTYEYDSMGFPVKIDSQEVTYTE